MVKHATFGAVVALGLASAGMALGSGDAGDGAKLYAENCAKCHGADGAADTAVGKAMKAAVLTDAQYADLDAAALKDAIEGNSKHKSVAGKVSETDLEAIAAHIRQLAGAGGGSAGT